MRLLTHHRPHTCFTIQTSEILSTSIRTTSLEISTPQPSCNLGFAVSGVEPSSAPSFIMRPLSSLVRIPSIDVITISATSGLTYVLIMTNRFTTLDMVCRTRSLKDMDPVIASDSEHSRILLIASYLPRPTNPIGSLHFKKITAINPYKYHRLG
jgi:hypothetical protein